MKIKFKCPKCGCKVIEEVQTNVTVASVVGNDVCFDGRNLELCYGAQTNTDGEVDRYQCDNCGHVIAQDNLELLAYLRKRKMIELEAGESFPVEISQCGSCGGYHRVGYKGDCRNDAERFHLPEDAGKALGSYVVVPWTAEW